MESINEKSQQRSLLAGEKHQYSVTLDVCNAPGTTERASGPCRTATGQRQHHNASPLKPRSSRRNHHFHQGKLLA
jgi:hypothetical protein